LWGFIGKERVSNGGVRERGPGRGGLRGGEAIQSKFHINAA